MRHPLLVLVGRILSVIGTLGVLLQGVTLAISIPSWAAPSVATAIGAGVLIAVGAGMLIWAYATENLALRKECDKLEELAHRRPPSDSEKAILRATKDALVVLGDRALAARDTIYEPIEPRKAKSVFLDCYTEIHAYVSATLSEHWCKRLVKNARPRQVRVGNTKDARRSLERVEKTLKYTSEHIRLIDLNNKHRFSGDG